MTFAISWRSITSSTPGWTRHSGRLPCGHTLHDAEFLVQFYKENGPSVVAGAQLLHPSNSFGMDGYLAMLIGQERPSRETVHPFRAGAKELARAHQHMGIRGPQGDGR